MNVTTVSMTAHGHRMTIEERPGKMTKCWRNGKPYEAPLLEHIYAQGFTGTAVDAGANYGNHTLWLAIVCQLDVWAFEPIQFPALYSNLALNNLGDRVMVRPIALGSGRAHARSLGKGKLNVTESGSYRVMPLDAFQIPDVSVIKADVEDMEPDLLMGAEETIERCEPVIYAEAHPGQHERIAAVVEPMGYVKTAEFTSPESLTPVEEWRC